MIIIACPSLNVGPSATLQSKSDWRLEGAFPVFGGNGLGQFVERLEVFVFRNPFSEYRCQDFHLEVWDQPGDPSRLHPTNAHYGRSCNHLSNNSAISRSVPPSQTSVLLR